MIITTTSDIKGKEIKKYIDVVSGETLIPKTVLKELSRAIGIGWTGRTRLFEETYEKYRKAAIKEMDMGAKIKCKCYY